MARKNNNKPAATGRRAVEEVMVLEEVQEEGGMTLDVGLILTTFLLLAGGLTYLILLYTERYGQQTP